ncbi:MAG: hypothetical protein LAO21_06240 [Acidobacteriia bacterium]|nr:hypothetical protein [Terriglobia bacterium]
MPEASDKAKAIGGIAVILGMVTGIASLISAYVAFFSGNWVGTGACLGAAGLAFGLIANALWRD